MDGQAAIGALPDHLTLPGVACWCGNSRLVCIEPGDEGDRSEAIGITTRRPAPVRGFCSVAHASGWRL
jgi:hypothetical protein